jgi:hypothetical protein
MSWKQTSLAAGVYKSVQRSMDKWCGCGMKKGDVLEMYQLSPKALNRLGTEI